MYFQELRSHPLSGSLSLNEKQSRQLEQLGLLTVWDLLSHFPFRYEDRSKIEDIQTSLLEQRPVSCLVTVISHEYVYFNHRRHPKIIVQDQHTRACLVGFNRFFLTKSLEVGRQYYIYAQFQYKFNEVQAGSFDFEAYDPEVPSRKFQGIFPVYRASQNLNSRDIHKIVLRALKKFPELEDELPAYLVAQHHLLSKDQALRSIHSPEQEAQIKQARLRISFDALFSLQLAVFIRRRLLSGVDKNYPMQSLGLSTDYLVSLPYRLTGAQQRVLDEISQDLLSPRPMHRLLQGDVGCGKTTVAFAAVCLVTANRGQTALLAPTEVLARQHYLNALKQLNPLGIHCGFLSSSVTGEERKSILANLAAGSLDLLVGTHALFQDEVSYHMLRFIIIDEQHKFGVNQRLALSRKGSHPDILVMTATPIPRTMTMTLYGDLDVSVIDELPPGRQPIRTVWVKDQAAHSRMLDSLEEALSQGHQAYIITPLIEDSEKSNRKSVQQVHDNLRKRFGCYNPGLLHGRMSYAEKESVMADFSAGRIRLLVSTTVIEVGVDVPEATVMIIEDADSFGLSQLHQLRGRVGRGTAASTCYLVSQDNQNPDTEFRMQTMVRHQDGFKIAEEDLRLRGPGEILGTRQSGLPELRFSEYLLDQKLLTVARKDAQAILRHDPDLSQEGHEGLSRGILASLPRDYLYSG